ncbi:hypothetical protein [Formosa sp. A9]|uniref:hypothetical protein n=1 Tax=Formosa sp. A9 TaxID=3442641 RepID=UPI003EB72D4B
MHININKPLPETVLKKLNKKTARDLNLLTQFYYDIIVSPSNIGHIKQPSPAQMIRFVKQQHKHENRPKVK